MPATRGRSFDSDVDALFQRPLSEFTSARNSLAARLKKEGRAADADRVKALTKPSTPAWAANQLFWEDPKAFDRLVAVTERVRKAQTGVAKNADLPALLDEKKKMMAALMTRASAILADSGHAASPDVIRRISATLESLVVWGRAEGVPRAGRLTADLDPPGFEALAAFMSGSKIDESAKVLLFRAPRASQPAEDPSARRARAREEVQAAEKALREARRAAERADTALARANARTAALEEQKREIEARYAEAKAEASAASTEAKKAAQAAGDAERALARARAEAE